MSGMQLQLLLRRLGLVLPLLLAQRLLVLGCLALRAWHPLHHRLHALHVAVVDLLQWEQVEEEEEGSAPLLLALFIVVQQQDQRLLLEMGE